MDNLITISENSFNETAVDSIKQNVISRYFGKYNPSSHGLIFERKVHSSRSPKYVPINTGDILAEMVKQGLDFEWQVLKMVYRSVNIDGTKMRVLDSTTPHIVACFLKTKDESLNKLGKIAFYIINSADGSKKLRGVFGWLNGACLNGCVFSECSLVDFNQRHIGEAAKKLVREDIANYVTQIKASIESDLLSMLTNIKLMTQTTMDRVSFKEFAKEAFELRMKYSGVKMNKELGDRIEQVDYAAIGLNSANREEFNDGSVWSEFQKIQENLKGNFQFESKRKHLPKVSFTVVKHVEEDGKMVVKGSKQSLKNSDDIDNKVEFNQELYRLVIKWQRICEEKRVLAA